MIDVASRATNGVKIPGRKVTRAEIMRMFKNHLTRLRNKLNVSHVLYIQRDYIVSNVHHRVLLLAVMSMPLVMRGRLAILTGFSL